jgi:hypothetical protein
MTNEKRSAKDVEGSGYGLIYGILLKLAWIE